MSNRPRRLRDFFNKQRDADRPSSTRETDELIDEIAETHELDLEGIARDLNRSHQRLWHTVEDEMEEESKQRD